MEIILPQINCKYAEEFIESLSPIGQYFKKAKLSETWLFRGQGRDFPLIPSAFRKNGKFSSLTNRNINEYGQRLLAERDIIIEFFKIADKRGLVLPDDSQQLRSILEILKSDRGEHFVGKALYDWQPTNKVLSLTALAQHYGVPTRLLDWSQQSYIAAFFAAESAARYEIFDELLDKLVVWAFYFPEFGKHDEISRENDPIRIVTAPTSTNPNLKSQQGVFTLLNSFDTKEAQNDYPSMDKFLTDLAENAEPEKYPSHKLITNCQMRKFTLPVSEANNLLYLLAKLDITSSFIYPGYQSIVDDLEMQILWSDV